MKLIGLLGGTSWPSTLMYYELLNKAVQERRGALHSARILLYSIDYHPIKTSYAGGWERIPALLAEEMTLLAAKSPDCIILCNNTLHKAFDSISEDMKLSVPVFHAGHLTAEEAVRRGDKTVLLLGTQFTMEDGFFAHYLESRGVNVVVPQYEDRVRIQEMQSNIALGQASPEYYTIFASLLARYTHVDSVVLACTELPLFINQTNAPMPIINPMECQCNAALHFAL